MMVKQLLNKLLVILIILALTSGNLLFIGTEAYAAFEDLENQKKESSDKNVSFDSYFYVNENQMHSATLDTKQEAYINFEINIQNGFLKESAIELNNSNFEIESIESQSVEGIVKNSDSKKIELNQINNNKKIIISAKIKENHPEYVESNYCSKESTITFAGNYTNIKGEVKNINSQINVGINWVSNNVISNIDENVQKYIKYENKSIIETKVTSTLNENVLPIKNTNINIQAPKINNNLPEEVRIHANSTVATNGMLNGDSFSAENWNYNKETGEITINVENAPTQEEKISWKQGTDEFIVTYIYNTEEITPTIELNAKNTINTYTENSVEGNVNKTQEITVNGNFVEYEIAATEKISKGYMYANSNYETQYDETLTANVIYKDAIEGIIFFKDTEAYNLEDGKKVQADTIYKTTKVNKANFNKILGENGQLKIYNGENLIVTIDNNTQVDEYGNLVYNYQANYNNIKIETTTPVSEGKLIIENNKALSAKSTYNYNTQKQIRNIEATLIGINKNQEQQTKSAITTFEETATKAQVQISKKDLSTVVTNENVELRAVLESDDITDDLYKNPTVRIELPEEIENVNVKSVNMLFNNELQIANTTVEAGRIINIALTGEQTQFITDNNKGITIIVNTDITLKKAATSKETQITMNYTNEKAINLENAGVTTTPLNIVAPVGVIAINSVTNTSTGETATSIGSNKEEIELKRNAEKTTATYNQTIINNESEPVTGMKILGRIGTEGDNLGSTISAKLASAVGTTENIDYTVYYSEKADATDNLQDSTNGWITEIKQNAKSYLIVINKEMAQGEEVNFSYNMELPENLEYGENLASTYSVEYNTQTEALNKTATPVVVLSTGDGPIIEATLEDNTADGVAYVEQNVKYIVTIKNKGTAEAEDVNVNIPVPDGFVYSVIDTSTNVGESFIQDETVKNIEINVGKLSANEEVQKEVYLYVKEAGKNENIIASIKGTNFEVKTTNSKSISTKVRNIATIRLTNNYQYVFVGETESYGIYLSDKNELKNVKVEVQIPEGMEFVDATAYDYDNDEQAIDTAKVLYNNNTRKLTIDLGEIELQEITFEIRLKATEKFENKKLFANIICDKGEQQTNAIMVNAKEKTYTVDVTSNVSDGEYIKNGEEVEYKIEIKNTSEVDLYGISTRVKFDSSFNIPTVEADGKTLSNNNEEYDYIGIENAIYYSTTIKANETCTIIVKSDVYVETSIPKDIDIENTIQIDELNYNKTYKYVLEKFTMEDDDDNNNDNPLPTPDNSDTYKISGTAWVDQNKDGTMEENETKLSGIAVKAIDNNGTQKATTTTLENGTYTLQNLVAGNYTVIFEYDTTKYMPTTYQKEGIEESVNSNVVKGTYEGKTVATTNTIEITNKSIANINIGLMEGSNFDLSLNKKVKQISMANTKKTQTKKYDTQLAKIDLDYKYINNTKVAIEYEITITNEGDIPGSATKIVDYLPEGFDFSTELNKDWYTSTNKNIETKALANTIINPGESKTVTLVLTKNMNENGNGIYSNTAEIAEDYNEYGQADTDSTPGNNKEGEDDQSSANVILGLKTGGPVTYITLTISIMAIICVAAYEINKRVLKF